MFLIITIYADDSVRRGSDLNDGGLGVALAAISELEQNDKLSSIRTQRLDFVMFLWLLHRDRIDLCVLLSREYNKPRQQSIPYGH